MSDRFLEDFLETVNRSHSVSSLNSEKSLYLTEALENNLRLQDSLHEQLNILDYQKATNISYQKKIENSCKQLGKNLKTCEEFSETGKSFFEDKDGNSPQPNSDSIFRDKYVQSYEECLNRSKWPREDEKLLRSAYLKEKKLAILKSSSGKSLAMLSKEMSPDEISKYFEKMNNLTEQEIIDTPLDIDWMSLAAIHFPTKSGEECRMYWEKENIKTETNLTLSKEQTAQLRTLFAKYGPYSWTEIAAEIGNVTPAQCLAAYQRNINTTLQKSKWTEEEDETLKSAVEYYGEKDWQRVAEELDGRSGQQCLHRWKKTLTPEIRKGRWTTEEDESLLAGVKAFGAGNWAKVRNYVRTRTDVQCRERYMNVLNPSRNTSLWTKSEDERLLKLSELYDFKWTIVSEKLGNRTDNQCLRRYKKLSSGLNRSKSTTKRRAGEKDVVLTKAKRFEKQIKLHQDLPLQISTLKAFQTIYSTRSNEMSLNSDEKLSKQYKTLCKTFKSIFFWPALVESSETSD